MNPRPTWEVLDMVYNEQYLDKEYYNIKALDEYRLKKVYPAKVQFLKKLKPSGRIIDIGAGLGSFVYLAKQAGYDIEGWEASHAEATMAKKIYNIDLKVGFLSKEHYSPETFDIVHMHHVFEHVPNPMETFQLVSYLLKPGGYFFFEIPNDLRSSVFYYNAFVRRFLGRMPFSKPSIHHLYFYNSKTILKFIKEANLQFVSMRGKFHEVQFQNQIARMFIRAITPVTRLAPSFEILCRK